MVLLRTGKGEGKAAAFSRLSMTFLLILIYIAFISLGLPDSLLGSAWPVMQEGLRAPVSAAGLVSMIMAIGTVISSLMSNRWIRRFGTAKVTAVSVVTTGLALVGFSAAPSVWVLCVLAMPLGLGAGCVDAALNNFVAFHFSAKHMTWLHCSWGIGATIGPVIMSVWLKSSGNWRGGYATVAVIQCVLSAVLFATLPKWRAVSQKEQQEEESHPSLTLRQAVRVPLARPMLTALFCYCSIELTTGLWGASYATAVYGVAAETAAFWSSLFYFGITAGRAVAGFLTLRLNNPQMIRLGQGLVFAGLALLLLPLGVYRIPIAYCVIGLGCAPIYPAMLHQTPVTFGKENSQAMMGVQMASAYIGSMIMPPLFGWLAGRVSIRLFPFYLLFLIALMTLCAEAVNHGVRKRHTAANPG